MEVVTLANLGGSPALRYDCLARDWSGGLVAELRQGLGDGVQRAADVLLFDESEVADAEDLAAQLRLAAGQHDVVLVFRHVPQITDIDSFGAADRGDGVRGVALVLAEQLQADRKSTRLNSSH